MKISTLLIFFLSFGCFFPQLSRGQITITPGATAMTLANRLVGSGVTIISATLTCPSNANGTFRGTSSLSFDSGIILTNGQANAITTTFGANSAAANLAEKDNGTGGDAQLTALAGQPTYDACILEFDFKPAGDTVKFKYTFGSEEYSCCACMEFNDVFGFFISGPGYSTPKNLALVPGTTIPVCINSINCVPHPDIPCTSLGTGSPFCSYYINNTLSSTIVYDGLTTLLTAVAAVTPCDTYHLKLGIADAYDHLLDSGVFLEAGSLSSVDASIAPVGLNPLDTGYSSQFCVRGCRPGKFIFSRRVTTADTELIHLAIGGTAVNGYDYNTIGDSVVIGAHDSTDTMYIYPRTVTAAGPKTIKLYVLSGYSCGGAAIILDSAQMTVYDSLTAITGIKHLCIGANTLLSDDATGGTWSSVSTGIAVIGSASGIATGVATGTDVISYSLGSGCSTATVVTVNSSPVPIGGTPKVCVGGTTTLSDGTAGGIWTSSNPAKATVTSGGIVSGVAPGFDTITYTIGGCSMSMPITVNAVPTGIIGASTLCAGYTTTLSDITVGGVWSVTPSGTVANITSGGVVSALAAGTATAAYTLSTGCAALLPMTINLTPAVITGTLSVCTGSATILGDATPGGVWSSFTGYATIGSSSGLVSGISAGLFNVTYTTTATGCYAAAQFTVNPLPLPILGTFSLCSGSTTTLYDAGGTWSTTGTGGIITVGTSSGVVTGGTPGSGLVVYTLPTGCSLTAIVSVNTAPGAITGSTGTCVGLSTTLADGVPGGVWTSSDYTVAYINVTTGTVTGLSVGEAIISYTLPSGCYSVTLATVNFTPTAIISTITSMCAGTSGYFVDTTLGGTWSSSDPTKATVNTSTGLVTAMAGGVVNISYSMPGGCYVLQPLTIIAPPPAITGIRTVCQGSATTLADTSPGGAWSSVSPATGSVNTLGVVMGIAGGTTLISYTSSATGCATTALVTVNPAPGAISGPGGVCLGGTAIETDGTGGSWSTPSGTISVGSTTGIVNGISLGTGLISYTLPTGCNATKTMTVNALPGPISGLSVLCVGQTTTETDAGGGTWSKSGISLTIGSATGLVTGTATGVSAITYTLPTGCSVTKTITVSTTPGIIGGTPYMCLGGATTLTESGSGVWSTGSGSITIGSATGIVTGIATGTAVVTYSIGSSCSATATITVNPVPSAISGTGTICPGSTLTLTAGGTGVWSSSSGVTVGSHTGIVTGSSGGLATVTYTFPTTGCYSTTTVTVNPAPGSIGGPSALCVGAHITLTETSTGVWSSGSTGVATIGSGTGVVTGIATGTSNITFTLPTGCTAILPVTVSLSPTTITGPGTVCTGASVPLADTAGGGVWSSTSTFITLGSLSGLVTGVTAGTAVITYSLGSGCTVLRSEVVITSPAVIRGTTTLCAGTTTTLTDATTGGLWSGGSSAVAVGSTGIVTGYAAGTAAIDYTTGGCTVSDTVTVNPSPDVIAGPATVCQGSSVTATDAVAGGTWSTTSANITIDGTAGTVTGLHAGTATISYTIGSCTATRVVTVAPIAAITGATTVCAGSAITLSDAAGTGVWSSADITVSVGSATGVITGEGAGTATLSYTTVFGCLMTTTVTVNTAPTTITGPLHICLGGTGTLINSTGGGTWSSTSSNITIGSATGLVTGLHPGSALVSYSLGTGCAAVITVTVDAPAAPITATTGLCAGSSETLTESTTGGTWSSSAIAMATIGSSTGIVNGIATGTTTITYTTTAGCITTAVMTINPLPNIITGIPTMCAGGGTTLTDATTGGTWSTAATIATVGSTTGIVSSSASGTAVITYTLPTGCATTTNVYVEALPTDILGSKTMCITAGTVLSDAEPGGTWSSADGAGIITVGSTTGLISGIALGSAKITYSVSGCSISTTVTVNPQPSAIGGSNRLCVGIPDTLINAAGGVWSSSNPIVASIGTTTGAVTCYIPGTLTITYSRGVGCTVTMPITVNPSPAGIRGVGNICLGATTTLTEATTGGIWSSSDITLATIGSTGITHGISGGTPFISYTLPATGCYAVYPVNVIYVPAITGITPICAWGSTTRLHDSLAGGSWTSTLVTVSDSADVLSYAPGTATITYTESHGCFTSALMTVNPLPAEITGNPRLCAGLTTTLVDTSAGGMWSSTAISVATIGSVSGIVTGVTTGTAMISYTAPVTGCAEVITVTVHALPSAIAGAANVCVGANTTLTDTASGGSWTSSNTSIATVPLTAGTVSGLIAGGVTISYTLGASCLATRVVTVNALPGIEGVTGGGIYCATGTGVHIGMGSSATGIAYQLFNGSTAAGTAITGTGSALDFGLIIPAGTYTVTATNTTTGCTNNMRGEAVVTISPSVVTAIHIAAVTGDTLCAGATAHFTSVATNGGVAATYQWALDGTAIAGATNSTYTYTPANGDRITTRLTSDTLCASPASVISNTVTLTVDPELVPTVVIAQHPGGALLPGQTDTLSATVTNGGIQPAYQWEVNSIAVPGATNDTYTPSNLNNADTVTCLVTSGEPCGGNTTKSNGEGIMVSNVGVPVTNVTGGLNILPNPNKGTFTIKGNTGAANEEVGITITDMLGQEVFSTKAVTHNGVLNQQVQLSKSIASGMYLVNVHTADGTRVFHVVVQQ